MIGRGRSERFLGGAAGAGGYVQGGFGGGGGCRHEGAGGGGYSGGGGTVHTHGGGGGGGSYIHSSARVRSRAAERRVVVPSTHFSTQPSPHYPSAPFASSLSSARLQIQGASMGGADGSDGEVIITKESEDHLVLDTCGAVGREGPTREVCIDKYGVLPQYAQWFPDSANGAFVNGIQTITIPSTGTYRITAFGARGGYGWEGVYHYFDRYKGGKGAKATGVFRFEAGQKISVVVGQSGRHYPSGSDSSPGGAGGGGTFVFIPDDTEPLLVAGGGGGGSYAYSTNQIWGYDGTATRCGSRSTYNYNSGEPGCNGLGGRMGTSCTNSHGHGGGGWRTNGYANCGTFNNQQGMSAVNGFYGGQRQRNGWREGGFGGEAKERGSWEA